MWFIKWIAIAIAIFVGISKIAIADALDSWTTWSTAQPYVSKQVPPAALVARGIGTDVYYVLEVDETTGEIPVSLSGASITIDYSGATGAAVPADAAFIGGTDGTNLRGIKTDTSGELQVDVLSSALPSGAATSALQTTGNTSLGTIAGAVSGTEMQVDVVAALPAGTNNIGDVDVTNFPTTVAADAGAHTSSTLRVTEASRPYADSDYQDYSSGNVTTAAWTELLASTAAQINLLCITDTSGQIMELGTGAGGGETRLFLIAPGFSGCVPLRIAASTRVAVKAVTATASTGYLTLSGMQ